MQHINLKRNRGQQMSQPNIEKTKVRDLNHNIKKALAKEGVHLKIKI